MLERFEFNSQVIRMEKRANNLIWVCLTDMAKASNKKVNDWTRLKSTEEFLTAFEVNTGFPVMESNVGGSPETTGTWGLEEVALDFAGWCSVSFKIWMLDKIKTLMKEGSVSLYPSTKVPQTYIEALEAHLKAEKEKEALKVQLEHEKFLGALKSETIKETERIITVQNQKIEEQQPKVEFYDIVANSKTNFSMESFAQVLCNKFEVELEEINRNKAKKDVVKLGRNNLFKVLRKCHFLKSSPTEKNNPYQNYLNMRIFEVVETYYSDKEGNRVPKTKTLVTPKGQQYLTKWIKENLVDTGLLYQMLKED